MKNLCFIYLIYFLVSNPSYAQQNWFRTNNTVPQSIKAISYSNQSTLVFYTDLRTYSSIDGGKTIKQLKFLGDTLRLYGLSYLTKDTLLVIYDGYVGVNKRVRFLKSDDGGNTFYPYYIILNGTDTVFKKSSPNYIYFFDSQHGMVSGDTLNGEIQCYLTNDGAKTWSKANLSNLNGLPSARFNSNIWQGNESRVGNDLYIGALGGASQYLLKITNYGANWSAIPINIPFTTFLSTIMLDSLNGLATLIYRKGSSTKAYLAKSNTGGLSWDTSITQPPGLMGRVAYAKATARNKAFHYCPDQLSGITYISYDTCKTWLRDDSLKLFSVYQFYDADFGVGQIRIGNDSVEIVVRDKRQTSIREVSQVQSNISIYPNPVSIQLHFDSPAQDIVVFDNLGKTYAVLLSEDGLQADLSALPAGYYFIRVQTQVGYSFHKIIKQ